MYLPGSSLRVRLVMLVVLAVLPMLFLMLHAASEESEMEIAHHREDTLRMARFIALDQERLIEGTHQLLVNIAQLPVVKELESKACSAFFASQLKLFPIYANFALLDPEGNMFSSGIPLTTPVNVSERPWFRNAVQSRDFMDGHYATKGIVSHEPIIVCYYPIPGETGETKAILCATLKLRKWLDDIVGKMQLPDDTILMIFDQSGTILAGYPDSDRWQDHSLQQSPLMQSTSTEKDGIIEAADVNGISRFFGLVHVPRTSEAVHITIGFPKNTVLAHANRALIRNIGLLVLATTLMLVITIVSADLLLLNRVRMLISASRRLAEGDLSARTGLRYGRSELSQLARTFDEMADSLERQRIESEQLEEMLRDSGRRFRAIFNQAFQFTVILDPEGTLLEANQTILDFSGLRNADVYSQPFWETVWWSLSPETKQDMKEAVSKAAAGGLVCYEVELRESDGKTALVDFSLKPLKDEAGRVTLLIAEGRDITARKNAENILRESEKELRLLSSRLLTAQEDERKLIARELHDSIGQSLSAIKFGVENSLERISQSNGNLHMEQIEALVPMVQYAIDEVRKIMTDLRPSLLDDLGILSTLEWFCREFQKIYSTIHIEKEFHIQEGDMAEPLKIVIFRVVQEAMNNIAKHSKASYVSLSLSKRNAALDMVIEDDGKGFDMGEVSERKDFKSGYGLSSMRERAELSGGSFSIESTLGEGTTIRASWPCMPVLNLDKP